MFENTIKKQYVHKKIEITDKIVWNDLLVSFENYTCCNEKNFSTDKVVSIVL